MTFTFSRALSLALSRRGRIQSRQSPPAGAVGSEGTRAAARAGAALARVTRRPRLYCYSPLESCIASRLARSYGASRPDRRGTARAVAARAHIYMRPTDGAWLGRGAGTGPGSSLVRHAASRRRARRGGNGRPRALSAAPRTCTPNLTVVLHFLEMSIAASRRPCCWLAARDLGLRVGRDIAQNGKCRSRTQANSDFALGPQLSGCACRTAILATRRA